MGDDFVALHKHAFGYLASGKHSREKLATYEFTASSKKPDVAVSLLHERWTQLNKGKGVV